jgi:ABC-type glycerol-3-phosphate transport system substrate-binding protein
MRRSIVCVCPKRTRRLAVRLTACVLLGALASGCAPQGIAPLGTPTTTLPLPTLVPATAVPSETPAPLSPLRGSVSIWTSWQSEDVAELADLLEAFRQQHPRVQVRLSYYRPPDLLQAFQAAAAVGQGPTILLGPAAWGPKLLRDGLIEDVSSRLLSEQRESISTLVWSEASSSGVVLGLPVRLRGVVLYRNRALAAQPAASLEDLLAKAAAISARYAPEPVFDLGFEFSGAQLTPCGGTLLRAGGGLAFDEATGICWLKLLDRFRQVGRPVFDSSADRATFVAGHSPWLIDTTDALPEIVQALGVDNVSIDAWPATEQDSLQLSGYVWSDNAYLAAGISSADLEASWALASLLIGPEEQARHAQAEGSWFLPVVETVRPVEPLAGQAQDVLLANTAMPIAYNLDVYTIPLERAVSSVVGQAADPSEALGRATEIIHSALTQSPPGG